MQSWCAVLITSCVVFCVSFTGGAQTKDATCFQTAAPYSPEVDIASDVSAVYGVDASFVERVAQWRAKGYDVSMMTGIAWGGYDAYYGSDGQKKEEIQTRKDGSLFMHGGSKTVGYNVPTDAYIDYIKKYIEPAVDQGVRAIYLEEPEFWALSGWSGAFKREWERFYKEPWQAPDSSVDAQYKASRLKYEMYFKALRDVFSYAKQRAKDQGRTIECHVPTHSLINYASWRIVSPESHLSDIDQFDGYVAQVWTGTARTRNIYRGVPKERTFETAFLEYGQMLGMVRPTGKKVWFLADPVEDNPDRSWADYKRNYECTLVASLFWPEVARYEVMPWPDRIFNGKYRSVDMDTKSDTRAGIPADYATELLVLINALNEMDQKEVVYDCGTTGIGVLVSDTLMFQRAAPQPSDSDFSNFYGIALPLVKHGIAVEPVQLENTIYPQCLKNYRILLLSYEGQKPLKSAYHDAINQWVRDGGQLIFIDDGKDPYHGVKEWWNENGTKTTKAYDDLFAKLGVTDEARKAPQKCGKGYVRYVAQSPTALAHNASGSDELIAWVTEMERLRGKELKTQNYLSLQRGPYVIAAVMDESVNDKPLTLRGRYVDLFDPALPVVTEKVLHADERVLLYDLNWAHKKGAKAKVVAAGARVKQEIVDSDKLQCVLRGPKGTHATARILLPRDPKEVKMTPTIALKQEWDASSSTLWLAFDNCAENIEMRITW